jgi:hypothetical protein
MPAETPVAPPEDRPTPDFPVIEAWVEQAEPQSLGQLFETLKEELTGLKGPRAEQGKKVQAAIGRTEELLAQLLELRQKLLEEQGAGASGRR